MRARRLSWAERVTRVCDLLCTMNFVTVAKVRADFAHADLESCARAVEVRHPLLRAAVERRGLSLRFVPGAAPPIPVEFVEVSHEEVPFRVERLLRHQMWSARDPRGRLVCLVHEDGWKTLLWSMHHLGGDGTSGMVVVRDLLRLLVGERGVDEPLPSPPQEYLFPPHLRARSRPKAALDIVFSELAHDPPCLLSDPVDLPPEQRHNRFVVRTYDTEDLEREARAEGATVHGLISARLVAVARARARGEGAIALMHLVDLRRMLRDPRFDAFLPEGLADMIGTYISYVQTRHAARAAESETDLARDLSRSIARQKALGVPLLTHPFVGRILVPLYALLPSAWLRRFLERRLAAVTLNVTNLGPLEKLGLRSRFGPIEVDELYFAAMPSVSSGLCASISSFSGRTHVCCTYSEPSASEDTARALVDGVGQEKQVEPRNG